MRSESMNLIFKYDTLRFEDVWMQVVRALAETGFERDNYIDKKGVLVSSKKILRRIESTSYKGISAYVEDPEGIFEISMNFYNEYEQSDFISFTFTQEVPNWDLIVKHFYDLDSFIYAYVVDDCYSRFQNNWDYESVKKMDFDTSNLILFSNTSGKKSIRVNTAFNPGREESRGRYFAAIGASMWLGKHFWKFSASTIKIVTGADWLQSQKINSRVLKIIAQDSCFSSGVGFEYELQTKLWDLLFPLVVTKIPKPMTNAEIKKKTSKSPSKSVILKDIDEAAKWMSLALKSSGYEADFSIKSLQELDRFFSEHANNGVATEGGLLSESLGQRLFGLGSYLGEVLKRHLGGEWHGDDADPQVELNIEMRLKNGWNCLPVQRVMKRFQSDLNGVAAYGAELGLIENQSKET